MFLWRTFDGIFYNALFADMFPQNLWIIDTTIPQYVRHLGVAGSDFEIAGKTFEVGGRKKGKKQIQDATEGYVVKDNIEYVFDNQVPLWIFGFLY